MGDQGVGSGVGCVCCCVVVGEVAVVVGSGLVCGLLVSGYWLLLRGGWRAGWADRTCTWGGIAWL